MALADWEIEDRVKMWNPFKGDADQHPHAIFIDPFTPTLVESIAMLPSQIPQHLRGQYKHLVEGAGEDGDFVMVGIPSYGLGSMGYDLRLGNNFKIPRVGSDVEEPAMLDALDLKPAQDGKFNNFWLEDWTPLIIDPGHMVLAETVETIRIPTDCTLSIEGKSSNARLGITLNTTVGEPGWKGKLTLEISNIGHLPVRIYPGMGICQIVFHNGEDCHVDYAHRKGKYHDAKGIETAKMRTNQAKQPKPPKDTQ